MLIQHPSQAGDRALDPKEALVKAKEDTAEMLVTRKLNGQEELEDVERAMGARMPYQEILRRLWKCNPHIVVKDGSPGNVALYAMVDNEEGILEERYVGGMAKHELPEYGYIITDQRGLPKREFRGWRSVLIGLIRAQVITYDQAIRQFGEANGSRSRRWHQTLQKFKR